MDRSFAWKWHSSFHYDFKLSAIQRAEVFHPLCVFEVRGADTGFADARVLIAVVTLSVMNFSLK
jgi:hypothetical protein